MFVSPIKWPYLFGGSFDQTPKSFTANCAEKNSTTVISFRTVWTVWNFFVSMSALNYICHPDKSNYSSVRPGGWPKLSTNHTHNHPCWQHHLQHGHDTNPNRRRQWFWQARHNRIHQHNKNIQLILVLQFKVHLSPFVLYFDQLYENDNHSNYIISGEWSTPKKLTLSNYQPTYITKP